MAELRTYGERARLPLHCSFFRRGLAARVQPRLDGLDPVQEYLIDQANLRGFFGAYSDRSDRGALDSDLGAEEIVVGLLQPHAPVDLRAVKLIVRMLQTAVIDVARLVRLAKRERAIEMIAWLVELVPPSERTGAIERLVRQLQAHPPRDLRRPKIRYSPERLVRHRP